MAVFTTQCIRSSLLPAVNQGLGGLIRWFSICNTAIFSYKQEKLWHFQVPDLLQKQVQHTPPLIISGYEDTEKGYEPSPALAYCSCCSYVLPKHQDDHGRGICHCNKARISFCPVTKYVLWQTNPFTMHVI